jgi:hypothetical protein
VIGKMIPADQDIAGARVRKRFMHHGEWLEAGRYLAVNEVLSISPRNRAALVEKGFLELRPIPDPNKTADLLNLLDLIAQVDRQPLEEGLRARLMERLVSALPRPQGTPTFRQVGLLWGDKRLFLEVVPKELTTLDLVRASVFHQGIQVVGYSKAGAWAANRLKGMPFEGSARRMKDAYEKVQGALPPEHRRPRTWKRRSPLNSPH